MMSFIRGVLWIALIGTALMFIGIWLLLPSTGDVADLIGMVVVLALVAAGISLVAWRETDEQLEYHREKFAFKDRVEAEWALQNKIQAVAPGGVLVLEHLLKRLAASRA